MNIGLYFGSFNPIHIGHLIIASFIADNTALDKVWFVVSPQNPLKKSSTLLNEYARLHLVNLAVEEDPRVQSSDIEFKLKRPSYTIDTLAYLQEKYPAFSFSIIMGSDSYENIGKWKNSELLLKKYSLFIYNRPGFKVNGLTKNSTLLNAPLLQISSTEVRANIRQKKSIRYLVPDIVRKEIERSGYYLQPFEN